MRKLFITLLFILLVRLTNGQVVISTNFFGSGVPTGITANAGILYVDVATRKEWRQGTIPKGTSWSIIASDVLVDFNFITGTVSISHGGTGQTTANNAINALLPSQVGNSGKYLTTNGTNTSWGTIGGGGTVTNFIFTNANGISGSVATSTTTPTLSLSLDNTGVTAGSYTNTNLTVNAAGQITAASNGSAGSGVTSVGATSPITSSGGTTPTISTSVSTNKLIGRATAGTGVMEEITLGTNLSYTGTTLNAASGGGEDWAATLAIGVASGGNFPILSDGDFFGGSGYNYNWTFGSDDQFLLRSDGLTGTTHSFYLDQNTINIGSVTSGRYLEITAGSNHLKNSTLIEVDAPSIQFNQQTGAGTSMATLSATGVLGRATIPTGTVTSIATTSPITGGTITSTGTIACATCVTSAASLTSNSLMIGLGSQASAITTTGTGVLTALGVNTGSAGAFVVNGGALGTPSSGTLTNCTGLPTAGLVNSAVTQAKTANYTAYTLWGNNTNAAAAPADITIKAPGQQALSATLTWTAGLAPSSTANNTYNWMQIGNMVQVVFTIYYATAGTTVTNLVIAFPSDMPSPVEPTALTGASDHLYNGKGFISGSTSGSLVAAAQSEIRRNSGDTAYEFNIPFASSTVKCVWATFWYFTN